MILYVFLNNVIHRVYEVWVCISCLYFMLQRLSATNSPVGGSWKRSRLLCITPLHTSTKSSSFLSTTYWLWWIRWSCPTPSKWLLRWLVLCFSLVTAQEWDNGWWPNLDDLYEFEQELLKSTECNNTKLRGDSGSLKSPPASQRTQNSKNGNTGKCTPTQSRNSAHSNDSPANGIGFPTQISNKVRSIYCTWV